MKLNDGDADFNNYHRPKNILTRKNDKPRLESNVSNSMREGTLEESGEASSFSSSISIRFEQIFR